MKKSLFISQNILQCSSFPTREIFWDMSYFNMLPFTIVSLVSVVSFTVKEERIFNKTKLNGYKGMSEWFYKSIGGKTGRMHVKSRWQQIKILTLNKAANCERIAFQIACVNKNFKSQFGIKGWETVFCKILNGSITSPPKKPGEEYRTAGQSGFPFILCLFHLCFPFLRPFLVRRFSTPFSPFFPHSSIRLFKLDLNECKWMTKLLIQISRLNTCLPALLNWFTEVFQKLQTVLQREKGFIIKQCMSCCSLLLLHDLRFACFQKNYLKVPSS